MGPHEVGEWTKNNHNVNSGHRQNFFSKLIFSKLTMGTMERTREFPKLSKSLSSFCLVKIIERERERHGLSLMDVKNKASWESFDYNVQIPYLQDVLFRSHKNNYIISLVNNRHSGSRHYFELHLILLCLYSK